MFVRVIEDLGVAGADCVILGCTEIPLIISAENSPLPVLDTTRLLAKYAVELAIDDELRLPERGWIAIRERAPL
jgi:aspartate racemase